MREIIFRGKRKDNGEWVEGNLVELGKESFSDPERYGICDKAIPIGGRRVCYNLEIHEVVPSTVGQYTGLTDKNGNRIFESDIVRTKFGRLCIVVWFSSSSHNGYGLVAAETVDNCLHTTKPDLADLYHSDNLEIKGNTYDNLELLGGKWDNEKTYG